MMKATKAREKAKAAAADWHDAPFRIFAAETVVDLDYQPYTQGTGYGRVRLLRLADFEAANSTGRFTFQDILVIDQAPRDIDGVVGGVITGEIQGELSHVSIRTARRGTPNAFVGNALEAFAPHEGELVRLEVFAQSYIVTPGVSTEAAAAFWQENRPELPFVPTFDAEYGSFDHLLDMDLSGAGGISPVSRFGGKATNLARLQHVLTGEFEA